MSLVRLALKNLTRSPFRSAAVFLCAALVAVGVLAFTEVIHSAEVDLRASLARLGADLVINPWGGIMGLEAWEDIRLMSSRTENWMPRAITDDVLAVDGVAYASPQLFLWSFEDSPLSDQHFVHLVAFDPASDFTLSPWMLAPWGKSLGSGQAVVGSELNLDLEQNFELIDYPLQVANRLEPTGTDVDHAIFLSYETARDFVAQTKLPIGYDSQYVLTRASGILVQYELGSDERQMFLRILDQVKRVRPLKSTGMLDATRKQMAGLIRSGVILLAVVVGLMTVFIGLVFTITLNERRQEIGVMRAVGFPRTSVVLSILTEGVMLALSGGALGALLAALVLGLFSSPLGQVIKANLVPLPWGGMFATALRGLALAILSVGAATLYPALRMTGREMATLIRE